jgi:hypothetical protein
MTAFWHHAHAFRHPGLPHLADPAAAKVLYQPGQPNLRAATKPLQPQTQKQQVSLRQLQANRWGATNLAALRPEYPQERLTHLRSW